MPWKKVKVLVTQSCLTLCNLMNCSLPDSSVHGILQARILEWLLFPSPGDLPNPGLEPGSPVLQADSLLSKPPGKPVVSSFLSFSCSVMSDSLQPHRLQHARLPCSSPTPGSCSNSCHGVWVWCHPTISSSLIPFSSCLQSFLAAGSFPMRQFFASGGQSIGASASASVFPMNIQGWFPLRLTSLILQSKGLSRVFSSSTVWKHQFFRTQPSLWSSSHIHTWLLEKP